ncbi:MAG: PEP-CTERM sorting domain-containing protein [Burkholderiales bacterium]|nr:PEP-CTERM sorting domain-containing protein [Burkholderiales bacterium]
MKKTLACSLVAAALFATGAARADLVTNGDFETGTFAGWTTTLDALNDSVNMEVPQAGLWGASFGGPKSSISQTLATVAGSTYSISFWLMLEADANGVVIPNAFEVDFGSFVGPTFTDATEFGYTYIEFLAVATSASTDLTFKFSQGPYFWDLDSVQVTLPEPGSLALLAAAGLGGVAATRRRKSSSTSA